MQGEKKNEKDGTEYSRTVEQVITQNWNTKRRRDNRVEEILEVIMAKNFPRLKKPNHRYRCRKLREFQAG